MKRMRGGGARQGCSQVRGSGVTRIRIRDRNSERLKKVQTDTAEFRSALASRPATIESLEDQLLLPPDYLCQP